jgi:hypothetical protein
MAGMPEWSVTAGFLKAIRVYILLFSFFAINIGWFLS